MDPHAVDSMLKKLTAMQDELDRAMLKSMQLGTRTPLGGGYAEQVAEVNREIGGQVVSEIVPKLTQAIDDLKSEIEKSRASYRNVDTSAEATMNDIRGRTQP